MSVSLLGIQDAEAKRALRQLQSQIQALGERMAGVISEEGTFIANLGTNTTKTTSGGEQSVTAGAISELNDLDDVPDGSTYGRVLDSTLDSNKVKAVRNTTGGVDIDGADVFDKSADDLDNVGDGSTYKRVANVNVSNEITDDSIEAGADIAPSKILISGATNLDDWRDGTDATKISGAQLANLSVANGAIANNAVNTAKIDADAITKNELEENAVNGHHFDELVVDEFQSTDMGSLQSDAQWDGLET